MLHTATTVRTSRTQRLIAARRFRAIFGKRVRSLTHRKRRHRTSGTVLVNRATLCSTHTSSRTEVTSRTHATAISTRKSFFTSILASRAQMLHTATTVRTSRTDGFDYFLLYTRFFTSICLVISFFDVFQSSLVRIDHSANMKTVFPILIVSIFYDISCICVVFTHSIDVITVLLTIVYSEPLFVMLLFSTCF